MLILKRHDTFDTDEKNKTSYSDNAVTKSKINFDFPTCVKLWVGSALGSALFFMPIRNRAWISINMEIWIRIGIKTMPIHNTVSEYTVPYLFVECMYSGQCKLYSVQYRTP